MNTFPFLGLHRTAASALIAAIVGSLVACSVAPVWDEPEPPRSSATPQATNAPTVEPGPLPPVITQAKSRWVPVPWSDLPGLETDDLQEAWPAWLQSCTRPAPGWAALCPDIRQLASAPAPVQRQWMRQKLQAYRVESPTPAGNGLLTAYYEPVLNAQRQARPGFQVPLYAPPAQLQTRKPGYTRQEMETVPAARAALRGKELVYLADPVDAMVLHIQGSGLINVTERDGSQRRVRLAFAGTNDQPYKSIGRWLLDQNLIRDASWPGIKAWIDRNPSRVNELLWQNPRVVFFKEETLPAGGVPPGPKGAQGVPLTAGRSIAVDRGSIPYGTPVWLKSNGPQTNLDRLVLAQDTGTAIVGAVRADYYAGSGPEAGELAGRVKQPLQLWALWPR
ncbi:murein transglycosylase A [Limnohabitans sp. G3-2]|uniref:murein transglycosylase A n=1 Tax=Limnohabitans sp. G3-2 TaxID=1100711 RepID=UPI001E642143|nr:MltA domain-containing protein [Limnohabitans sp. G3-2]